MWSAMGGGLGHAIWRIAMLLLLAAGTAGRVEAAEGPNWLPSGLGVHVQVWQTAPADLERIRDFGFSFIRWGISWEAVEKSPGVFDWAATDAFFDRIRQAGLPSIVILATGNPLYGNRLDLPSQPSVRETKVAAPPETDVAVNAFSRFASAAAERYADVPVAWEIWNEPDSAIFWPPVPHPEAYARLAGAACEAIKAAVPQATVLGPATATLPNRIPAFYEALAKTSAARCLDGLSVHSYRVKRGVRPDPESVEQANIASRAVLDGISSRWRKLPMLCTEWGYPTSSVDPNTQATYLVRTYLANLASGVAATVWYEWKDSRDEADNPEAHFGLQTQQGDFKAKLDDGVIKRLLSMKFVRRLGSGDPRIRALLFREGNADQVVAWLESVDPDQSAHVSIAGRAITLRNVPTITPGDEISVSGHPHAR